MLMDFLVAENGIDSCVWHKDEVKTCKDDLANSLIKDELAEEVIEDKPIIQPRPPFNKNRKKLFNKDGGDTSLPAFLGDD